MANQERAAEMAARINEQVTNQDGVSRRDFLAGTGASILVATGAIAGVARLLSNEGKANGLSPEPGTSTTLGGSTTTSLTAAETLTNADNWRPTNFLKKPDFNEALKLPWANGKYETFPRIVLPEQPEGSVLQMPDIGTLGPDVDTIFGIDFSGLLKTGATVVSFPEDGVVTETRVVGIKRTDVDYVQFQPCLGGDKFDLYKAGDFGNDHNLDIMAQKHAFRSAHTHQMVVYIGDLGMFEEQWGAQEQELLKGMIRAQTPSKAGLPLPNFIPRREAAK